MGVAILPPSLLPPFVPQSLNKPTAGAGFGIAQILVPQQAEETFIQNENIALALNPFYMLVYAEIISE